MSRRSTVPSYRLHKQSGQAIVTLRDAAGNRRDVLLGKHGTEESRAEYARVIAEWEATGRRLPKDRAGGADKTINELILDYWHFVESYYCHLDGTPTSEQDNIRQILRRLRVLYGHTRAATFDGQALETLRDQMIEGDLGRKRINKDVARVKRLFKWAASKKLAPVSVFQELQTVEGLRAGRSKARETVPIKPVAEEHVTATLPALLKPVAAMAQLQLLAGMRPGEVVVMRPQDLDRSGKVWTYRPGRHKATWRGHGRAILLGPRAQAILRPFLFSPFLEDETAIRLAEAAEADAGARPALSDRLLEIGAKPRDPDVYLFSPAEGLAVSWAAKRKTRKSPVQPSQQDRRKASPQCAAGAKYLPRAYATAVARACRKAGVPHWHPNQLRHTKATEIRREAGLDAARAVLGHRSPAITEVYAELDMGKAAEIMERIG